MNIARLRKRGWSEAEITHAQGIMAKAEQTRHPSLRTLEHLAFWLLIALLLSGTVGVAVQLFPVVLLASPAAAVSIMFVLGSCFGLFLVHALHDLKLDSLKQHTGVSLLTVASAFIVGFIIFGLEKRFANVAGAHAPSAIIIGLLFALGIAIPYLVHWRINGTA